MNHEEGFIAAFIRPERQDAYRSLLSDASRRHHFGRLAKSCDFVTSHVLELNEGTVTPEAVAACLEALGCTKECFIVSEFSELDGSTLSTSRALDLVVGSGRATFISCIPGRLGYFEGADFEERFVCRA